jgi:hypothetical protein
VFVVSCATFEGSEVVFYRGHGVRARLEGYRYYIQ